MAGDLGYAADSMNALGIDLLARVAKPNENALISPYSIQSALAMTYAGAAGETKTEMAKVLHYPADNEAALHSSFAAFRAEFERIHTSTLEIVKESAEHEGPSEAITLETANRLYGQSGYAFRSEFLSFMKSNYVSSFQICDFVGSSESARNEINRWVSDSTHMRINNLLPSGSVNQNTRIALVNAVYFKGAWAKEFSKYSTRKESFWVNGANEEKVSTMQRKSLYGYFKGDGFCAVTIRYVGNDLQMLILLPDEKDGLAALEKKLTAQLLVECANPAPDDFILHLPKFKLEPPLAPLAAILQSLGLRMAFDAPKGSADFERMAPRKLNEYLYLSEVFHKTFIAVDEQGTEAAAATAAPVTFGLSAIGPRLPKPIELRVDHPFIFAIQHRASGACLFLGRVVDPR